MIFYLYYRPDSPPILNIRGATSSTAMKPGQVGGLKTLRMGRKDYKKGGEGLRGKNVTEAFRVKDKDLKRTMKWSQPPGLAQCLFRAAQERGPVRKSDNGAFLDSIEVYNNSSIDRRTKLKVDNDEILSEKKRKRSGVNKHQSRPSCLQRQTSDSSVCEYGAKNYKNDTFELIWVQM